MAPGQRETGAGTGRRIGLFLLIAAAPPALGFMVLRLNKLANPGIVFS